MQVKKNSLRQEPIVHALYNQFKPINKMSLVSKHSVVVGTDPVKRVFFWDRLVHSKFFSAVSCRIFTSPWVGVSYFQKGLHQLRVELCREISNLPSAACLFTWLVGCDGYWAFLLKYAGCPSNILLPLLSNYDVLGSICSFLLMHYVRSNQAEQCSLPSWLYGVLWPLSTTVSVHLFWFSFHY